MSTIRGKIATAAVLASLTALSAATAANAAAPFSACNFSKGPLCAFYNANYESIMDMLPAGYGLYDEYGSRVNAMSSWVNSSGTTGAWYNRFGGSGTCRTMGTYSYGTYIFLDGVNDTMLSWRHNRGC